MRKPLLLLALALVWLPSRAFATASASLPNADLNHTVQDDGQTTLRVRITNVSGTALNQITFNFASAAPYSFSDLHRVSFPAGWIPAVTANNQTVAFNATGAGIPTGGFNDFDLYLVGNGGTNIPRAAADVTDTFQSIQVRHSNNVQETTNALTWKRHGFALTLFATPASLTTNGTVTVRYRIENRTTAAQATVASNPAAPATVPAGAVNGPAATTPASIVTIASGDSGLLTWSGTPNGTQSSFQFQTAVRNGAGTTTSPPTKSNVVSVNSHLTAQIGVSPDSVISGAQVTVTMTVQNNGPYALGNLTPSRDPATRSAIKDPVFTGTATAVKVSGPTPSSVASVAPGSDVQFTWVYTVTGGLGTTYSWSGGAIANGFVSNLATSDTGSIAAISVSVDPGAIARGDTGPLTFSLGNQSGFDFTDNIQFTYPAGFVVSSAPPPAGYTSAITNGGTTVTYTGGTWTSGSTLQIPMFYTATGVPIPPSGADQSYLINVRLVPGLGQYFTNARVLVTANRLALTSNPSPATVTADGTSTIALTATATNVSTGLPVSGQTVRFDATQGTLSSGTGVTNALGVATVTLTAPASATTLTGNATATWFNTLGRVGTTFNAFAGGNLLYVGGTLFPRQVAPGSTVAFSIGVMNVGSSSISLPTGPPTTFQFTNGAVTYSASLAAPITIPADGNTYTIAFASAPVSAGFAPTTSFFPTFSYNPTRSVTDSVLIAASPTFADVVGFDAAASGGGVHLSWSTDLEIDNAGFRIWRASDAGDAEPIGWVPATGASFSDYAFDDAPLADGTYTYWLDDVDASGNGTRHGPVSIALGTAAAGASSPDNLESSGAPQAQPDLWTDPAAPADAKLLAAGDDGLTWEIDPPPFETSPVPFPVELRDRIRIPGYASTEDPGLPDLPVRHLRIPMPPNTRAVATILALDETTVSGLKPTWYAGDASPLAGEVAGHDLRPRGPQSIPGLYPSDPVRLVSSGRMGAETIASLVVTPLRWDGSTATLHAASRIVVRVRFEPQAPAALAPPTAAELEQRRIAAADSVKVSVSAAGLVRVPLASIASLGAPESLGVYREGVLVPSAIDGGELLFAARSAGSPWSASSAFWIAPADHAIPALAATGLAPAAGGAASVALRAAHFEQDLVYQPMAAAGRGADRWYWTVLQSGAGPLSATDTLDVPGAIAPGPATLSLRLQGTYDDGSRLAHAVQVSLDGTDLGTVTLAGWDRVTATLPLPAGLLAAGANTLTLTLQSPGVSAVALDAADLVWTAPADAAGAAELTVTATVDGPLTAAGFAEAPRWALDETAGALLPLSTAPDGAGGWLATAAANAGHAIRFVTPAAASPATIAPRAGRSIFADASGADYLVIAAHDLAASSQGFADYRRAQGLRARVVDIADLDDEIAFGDPDPAAIRRFLELASSAWPAPAPRFLLLVGDSTYDPLGHSAAPPAGLLLSPRIDTGVLEVASDVASAALGGADALPDLAVGRIPAKDPAGVAAALAKVEAYESAPRDGWDRREVMLADDELPEFDATRAGAAALAQTGSTTVGLSAASLGAAQSRAALLDSISGGVAVASYFGHGGVRTWGSEPFLSASDAPALTNARLPIVVAVDCLNAFFDHPAVESLGEELVRSPSGAAAVWASSAITHDGGHHALALAFEHAMWREPVLTVGDAVQRAIAEVAWRPDADELVGGFVLIGDPALRINANRAPLAKAALARVDGLTATLDGSGSWDAEGDALSWRWTIVSGPAGAHLDGADTPGASLVATLPGTWRVRLEVADGRVMGPADDLAVTLSAPAGEGGGGCSVGGTGGALPWAGLGAMLLAGLIARRRR